MIVIKYTTLDPLSIFSNALATLGLRSVWYSKKGEHGLLEDYLTSKGYIIDSLEEVEVSDDFNEFTVFRLDSLHTIDITNCRIHLNKKALEPSLN